MNRLTKHTPDDFGYCEYELKRDVDEYDHIDLLGQYEDTELTPAEINMLKFKVDQYEKELEIVYKLADKMAKAAFKNSYTSRDLTNATIEYESWCHAGETVNEDYE